MEAELAAVVVVGETEDWGGATPERLAAVSITLVLLEELEELHEHDAVTQHQHIQLLQVGLLQCKGQGSVLGSKVRYSPNNTIQRAKGHQ